jgi:hypothetical protein
VGVKRRDAIDPNTDHEDPQQDNLNASRPCSWLLLEREINQWLCCPGLGATAQV